MLKIRLDWIGFGFASTLYVFVSERMHLREFALCVCSLSHSELCMPEVLCNSDRIEVKPASRAKAVKEAIIQKPLTCFYTKTLWNVFITWLYIMKVFEKKKSVFSILIPPTLLYLPVRLKTLTFARVFTRTWCTVAFLGHALHLSELQEYGKYLLVSLSTFDMCACMFSDMCTCSPSFHH